MGCRLHTAKIYKIEYADCRVLNYQMDAVAKLLIENNVIGSDDDYWRYEVSREGLKEIIEKLKTMDDTAFSKYNFDVSKDYVIESFEEVLNKSDPNNDYILFEWF